MTRANAPHFRHRSGGALPLEWQDQAACRPEREPARGEPTGVCPGCSRRILSVMNLHGLRGSGQLAAHRCPEDWSEIAPAAAQARAKAICLTCPVMAQCRADNDAREADEPFTDWFMIRAAETPGEQRERRLGKTSAPTLARAVKALSSLTTEPPYALPAPKPKALSIQSPRPATVLCGQQVARLTGVSVRQLRYWDKLGVARPSVQGTEGVQGRPRLYSEADVARIRAVLRWVGDGHRPSDFDRMEEVHRGPIPFPDYQKQFLVGLPQRREA